MGEKLNRHNDARRRLLKKLVSGGTAVTAFSALPASWKQPIINFAMLPAHAQSTTPAFIQSVAFAYSVTGPEGIDGTLTPGNTPETHIFNTNLLSAHTFAFTPQIVVDPSITDTFNLQVNEVVAGGDSTNFSPSSQNVAPDNVNGALPYDSINASVDNARFLTYQLTLTPSNPALTTFFLEITFDEAPAGPGAP